MSQDPGRLLWIQQRQQRGESEHCRVDTIANVADMGTKVLTGQRVRMSLHLCSFQNDWGVLGLAEFEEEKQKKLAREKVKAVRKIVHAEMLDTPTRENSTLVNQVAKRLMRLTLGIGALLLSGGEALSFPHQSSAQCLVAMESTSSSLPWTTVLVTLVFILVVTIMVLIKIMHVMHLRIEATREAMDW